MLVMFQVCTCPRGVYIHIPMARSGQGWWTLLCALSAVYAGQKLFSHSRWWTTTVLPSPYCSSGQYSVSHPLPCLSVVGEWVYGSRQWCARWRCAWWRYVCQVEVCLVEVCLVEVCLVDMCPWIYRIVPPNIYLPPVLVILTYCCNVV